MILVDTSVWVDHFRTGVARLVELLGQSSVLSHPFVIGELACGQLANRGEILSRLGDLPSARTATHDEVLHMIEVRSLMGRGIGWVDAHLLASASLTPGARLWTLDRRLHSLANEMGVVT